MLYVQEYLRTHTFGELASEWGVIARLDAKKKKFSLNYDMILWTPGHEGAEQCRGVVLSPSNILELREIPTSVGLKPDPEFCPGETTLLAYPMDKFYNLEEIHASKIDWNDKALKVYEKLDGTLAIVYFDNFKNEWHVATRSVPEADLPIDGFCERTFRSLFEEALLETTGFRYSSFVSTLNKSYTYCFEITSPYNRILVEYKKPKITHIATRSNVSHQELDIIFGGDIISVPKPQVWPLKTQQEVFDFVNNKSPFECEGAVIINSNFKRVKIKSPKWVVANYAKTTIGSSPRNLVRYVLQGIADDVRMMLPEEMQKKLDSAQEQIHNLFKETDSQFALWKAEATDRKHFAELVNLSGKWGPFFKLYENKHASTFDFVQSILNSNMLNDKFIDNLLKHIRIEGENEKLETTLLHQKHSGVR